MWLLLLLCCLSHSLRSTKNSAVRSQFFAQLSLRDDMDPYESFNNFEKLLFSRFGQSVSEELYGNPHQDPKNYKELMTMVNYMTRSRPIEQVNRQGRNMLVRLFPSWLLPAFKIMFANPLPTFSAYMNCWVTHYTTKWLMGNSTVSNLELKDQLDSNGIPKIAKDQLLTIEKCRFLEEAGCVRTCIHSCKLATQSFFLEDMGIPVTLRPNFSDLSCRFEFGNHPLPIEDDEELNVPCFEHCSWNGSRSRTSHLCQ